MKIKIVSPVNESGLVSSNGTKILTSSGEEVLDVLEISVVYRLDHPVVAYLAMEINPETIEANPMLTLPSLYLAAEYYNMKLVPAEGTH